MTGSIILLAVTLWLTCFSFKILNFHYFVKVELSQENIFNHGTQYFYTVPVLISLINGVPNTVLLWHSDILICLQGIVVVLVKLHLVLSDSECPIWRHDAMGYDADKLYYEMAAMHNRVATKNLQRFLERLLKESVIKGDG